MLIIPTLLRMQVLGDFLTLTFLNIKSCKFESHWQMITYVFQKYPENFVFQKFTCEICYFLKKVAYVLQFLLSFLFVNKTFRLNNLNPKTAMNAKISVLLICLEAVIYLLLYNLHDYTFKLFVLLPIQC